MNIPADNPLPGMPAGAVTRPPVVVDLDLDDIPETTFSPYKFKKIVDGQTVIFTLKLQKDYLLAEFAETARGGDVYDLYCNFLLETVESAKYEDGTDVNVEAFLIKAEVDVDQYRKDKVDAFVERYPDEIVRNGPKWIPDLEPADILLHMVYERDLTLKVISQLVQSAIAQWSDELTDSSMRPQRLSRRDRRARR